MKRRTLLVAIAGAMIAGCSGSDGETADPEDDSDADADVRNESAADPPDEGEGIEAFRARLEERGFQEVTVDPIDDHLDLRYDASGVTEDDVVAEIELIADGYTTLVERGLTPTRLEATAYDPRNGEVLDYFTIETEWVEAYLSEEIEWRELLVRIADTFVSVNDAADDGDDGGETDDAGEGNGEDGSDGENGGGEDG